MEHFAGWIILLPRIKYTHEIVGTHAGALLPEHAPGAKSLVCINLYGGNVVHVPVHFFSQPLIFTLQWWPLAFLILSPLQNFHVVLPTKKCLLRFFISRSKSLSPFFSLSFAGLPPTFSFSLSFSCSIFQICGHDNIYLSLILQTTLIHKQFSLSVFVFIDSFVVSPLQDANGYAISHQNNLELQLGCHIC